MRDQVMGHELVEFTIALAIFLLGVGSSAAGWLVLRMVGRMDAVEKRQAELSLEVRDTRSAISRLEGHIKLAPFTYERD